MPIVARLKHALIPVVDEDNGVVLAGSQQGSSLDLQTSQTNNKVTRRDDLCTKQGMQKDKSKKTVTLSLFKRHKFSLPTKLYHVTRLSYPLLQLG